MKKKKWLWILIAAVVLVIVLVVVLGGKKESREVTIEKVEVRSLVENVLASGKIQPETEIKIQSQISGQIIELPIKEGDVVTQGQLLVKINPDIYISALNRADAALNSARSNLASAKARLAQSEAQFRVQELNMNRQKNLFDQKAISQAEFDNAVSQFETAKAEVVAAKESIHAAEFSIASAQASQNEAADNLKRTTITSPMTGTVTALTKEIGETVLGNNMMSGEVIMRISALNSMEVNVEVNESDIVRVGLGDTALVEVDAYKDKKFKGLVTEIGNTALNALNNASMSMDQVTNFSVKVRILRESYLDLADGKPESFSPFRPGMSADVEIQTARADNVLTIPIKAVTSREDTTSMTLVERIASKAEDGEEAEATKRKPFTCVFVYNEANGTADLRVVKTGIQDDQYIHIAEGLNAGEQIITGPYEEVSRKLIKGDKVTLKQAKKLEEKKD